MGEADLNMNAISTMGLSQMIHVQVIPSEQNSLKGLRLSKESFA